MKPIKFEQLIFQEDRNCFTIYLKSKNQQVEEDFFAFWQRMLNYLENDHSLKSMVTQHSSQIIKILKSFPDKNIGFFFSQSIQGYLPFSIEIENFYLQSDSFHLKPLFEELFTDPQFAIVALGEKETKIFLADSYQIDLIEVFQNIQPSTSSLLSYNQLQLTHQVLRYLKNLSEHIEQHPTLSSLPILLTGSDSKCQFLLKLYKGRNQMVILDQDFSDFNGIDLSKKIPLMVKVVRNVMGENLQEQMIRWRKSDRLVFSFEACLPLIKKGELIKIFFPIQTKIWGQVDFENEKITYSPKPQKGYFDLYQLLAEFALKNGVEVQFMPIHFFNHEHQLYGLKLREKEWKSILI